MYETADQLHSAAIHLLRRVRVEDAQTGVAPARLSALSVLVFRGPLTVGELAMAEGVRSPTMTRIVHALELAGLARRRPHKTDARASLVSATAKGKRVIEEGRRRRVEMIASLLAELDSDDLKAIQRAAESVEKLFGVPH
jgi:DNA-binding MarR family transcriptional regulator